MKNILFIMDSCHMCLQSIDHLNNRQISFEIVNIFDFEKAAQYKHILQDQALPLFLKEGEVLALPEILEL